MRQREDDAPATTIRARQQLRVISGNEEATCSACGAPTGLHPKWWFDGDNELVPFCAECSDDYR
jgi:hypothetical protein